MARTHTMTLKDLGATIEGVGNAAMKAQKDGVFRAALHMKNVIERERNKDLKGKDYFRQMLEKKTKTGNFVGVRPETHRLTIGFDVRGTYNPTALLVARGPWGLLEYGSFRHEIVSKSPQLAQMRRGRTKSALVAQRYARITAGERGAFSGSVPMGNRKTGFGPVYRVPMHPGVKGKQTFSRAVEMATPKSTQLATTLIQTKIIQHLRTQFGTFVYIDNKGPFRPVVG